LGAREEIPVATMIIASLVGILVGLCFHFLALVPLTIGTIVYCYLGTLGDGVAASLLPVIVPVIGLQGGYMIGLTGRDPLQQVLARFGGQSRRA
jgi:uncharacterized protein YacL